MSLPLVMLLTVSGESAVGAASDTKPGKAEAAALDAIARKMGGRAADFEVLTSASAQYGRQTARSVKVVDRRTGDLHQVTVDANGEREIDAGDLEARETAASIAANGRIHPALSQRLRGAGASERVPVIIWLKEASYNPPARPTGDLSAEQADQFLKQVDEKRAAAVKVITAPAEARLRAQGHENVHSDSYAPVVYAVLPVAAIRGISEQPEVDLVYLDNSNEAELNAASATIRAGSVHAAGFTGTGVKVGEIEVGGRIAANNPYLSGTVQDPTSVCAGASAHSTAVAGMIRSTHPTYKGIAPGVTVRVGGSCSGSSAQLQSRSTAAVDWGARALNLSWGSDIGLVPGANDRFYDNLVINRFRSVVKSAGNIGTAGCPQGSSGNITSPGLAYNVLTVGNFDDKNTSSWTGDAMNACSSWRDPTSTHGDREKPDVAAPGTNIISTTVASPWVGNTGSGTSYAAPMVTGTAALMMQRNANLAFWPEGVRAIMQATAWHNIEGANRLSEFDGAGGIDSLRASWAAARINSSGWGGRSYDCATTTQIVQSMTLTGGRPARVAIAWDNDPAFASYASRPSADIDLRVINSAGNTVAGSFSFDNTYEIVHFTPATTGTYRIRVNRVNCSLSPRFLAWAWSNI